VDISIEGYGNPYFLPRLSELWEFQAGYRYHAYTAETIRDWKSNWFVVAAEGADPFIFDSNSERVLHDIVGRGEWDPDEAFPDLNSMAACLASIGSVIVEAGDDLTDAETQIRKKYCAELRRRLGKILDSAEQVELTLAGLGCEPID